MVNLLGKQCEALPDTALQWSWIYQSITMNLARDYLRADKMGSTDIIKKWTMGQHENRKKVQQNKLHNDTTRNQYHIK